MNQQSSPHASIGSYLRGERERVIERQREAERERDRRKRDH